LNEFISLERRYVLRDWEPAELDGGQFAEILARIIYHLDSGNLNRSKDFEECVKYLENDQVQHSIIPRQHALHICRVLRTLAKFRGQRGAVHITPQYSANQMDARLMVECVRWAFSEALRIWWNADRNRVATIIRELLDFDVPCIGKFEDILLVQRTDLITEEEVLVLLHYAGEKGFTRKYLGQIIPRPAPRISEAVKSLASPDRRLIIELPNTSYRLTDLGSKFVRDGLSRKLSL
jgi:hypothetical protein